MKQNKEEARRQGWNKAAVLNQTLNQRKRHSYICIYKTATNRKDMDLLVKQQSKFYIQLTEKQHKLTLHTI